MIRRATEADIPKIVEMALKFVAQADLPPTTPQYMTSAVERFFQGDDNYMRVSDNGVIIGMISRLFYNPEIIEAHEIIWWSEDKQGPRLLRGFERWAQANGARISRVGIQETTDSRVKRFLTSSGYVRCEESYKREF